MTNNMLDYYDDLGNFQEDLSYDEIINGDDFTDAWSDDWYDDDDDGYWSETEKIQIEPCKWEIQTTHLGDYWRICFTTKGERQLRQTEEELLQFCISF